MVISSGLLMGGGGFGRTVLAMVRVRCPTLSAIFIKSNAVCSAVDTASLDNFCFLFGIAKMKKVLLLATFEEGFY